MPSTLDFPTSADFKLIQQKLLPAVMQERKLMKLFPFESTKFSKLIWDQMDDYIGLQQIRGLDGTPARVAHTGSKRYVMEPGAYGEFEVLGEKEMTEMAELGTPGEPLDFDNKSGQIALKLLTRECDRIEVTISTLCRTGTFTNQSDDGGIVHTDKFPTQSFTPGTAWSTTATATPLTDIRGFMVTAMQQGSFDFTQGTLLANQATVNQLLNNRNASDLFGIKSQYGATVNYSLGDVNKILLQNDLPQIEVYNRWYRTTTSNVVFIIPDNYWIWIAKRPNGERVGSYMLTKNIIEENAKDDLFGEGEATEYGYYKIRDRRQEVPPSVEYHRGHNGGPVLYFPSAVACISY